MSYVHQADHPLLRHALTRLRDKNTSTQDFHRHAATVSQILIMEATKNVPVDEIEVETPIQFTRGYNIHESLVFVPVLRAGISMLFPAREFLPWAPVGFIGLERNEKTAIAREYYQKFPDDLEHKRIIVLDPMLATGGSLVDTITALRRKGANTICVVCIVAAPEGIAFLQARFPEVDIFTAAIDSHLNGDKYIVPGLGDFGDRYFGT